MSTPSTPRVDVAVALGALLNAAGVKATHDPRKADTNRPCALLAPPVLDYTAGTMEGPAVAWRLVLLSSHPAGTLDAWRQLDALLDQVDQLVDVERAEPASYALTEAGTVPAYVLTITA